MPHGQSLNNVLQSISKEHFQKHRVTDPPLSDIGIQQAMASGIYVQSDTFRNSLVSKSKRVSAIYASAQLRALMSALPLGIALRVSPSVWPAIHEFGAVYCHPSTIEPLLPPVFPWSPLPPSDSHHLYITNANHLSTETMTEQSHFDFAASPYNLDGQTRYDPTRLVPNIGRSPHGLGCLDIALLFPCYSVLQTPYPTSLESVVSSAAVLCQVSVADGSKHGTVDDFVSNSSDGGGNDGVFTDDPTPEICVTEQGWWPLDRAEDQREFRTRRENVRDTLFRRARVLTASEDIIMITHGDFLNGFLQLLLHVGDNKHTAFVSNNSAWTVIDIGFVGIESHDPVVHLRQFNSAPHLANNPLLTTQ